MANYLLSDRQTQSSPSFLNRSRPSLHEILAPESVEAGTAETIAPSEGTIPEVSEPPSLERFDQDQGEEEEEEEEEEGPSALTNLLRRSPPESVVADSPGSHWGKVDDEPAERGQRPRSPRPQRAPKTDHTEEATEHTPLLSRPSSGAETTEVDVDLEGQKGHPRTGWFGGLKERAHDFEHHAAHTFAVAVNPKRWNRKAIWQSAVVAPASSLPAVCVGLLLNILDALSYGKHSDIEP